MSLAAVHYVAWRPPAAAARWASSSWMCCCVHRKIGPQLYCRDADRDWRTPCDQLIASWLIAVGCDAAASARAGARTPPKRKCEGCLSAITWVYGRARGWHFRGSMTIEHALETTSALPSKVDRANMVRPERDLKVIFDFIISQGPTDELTVAQLRSTAITLLWIDTMGRRSSMRGLQPRGV